MGYYFAYGSNMDYDDLEKWCNHNNIKNPQMALVGTAILDNFKLVFNYYSIGRGGGAANITESENSKVYGLLFMINDEDIGTLRTKEGYPSYYNEIEINVTSSNITYNKVKTYKVVKKKEKSEYQKPTKEYMNLILCNAIKNKFPNDYIKYLKGIELKN